MATSLSGFLKAASGVLSSALINLATDITGILPVGNGGTGWAALASGAIPYGSGGSALATTSAGTAGQVLALLNGVPTWTATSTLATISGLLGVGNGGTGSTTLTGLLKGNGTGQLQSAIAGVDYTLPSALFAYLFPGNATSTLLSFTGGLLSTASATLGNGAQAGGLTIAGGATTTGNANFGGSIQSLTGPSLTVVPTGNPSIATMTTFNLQSTTTQANTREFLASIGLVSNIGSGGAGNLRDKVGLYTGVVGRSGTGDLWAFNPLLQEDAGSGSYNGQVVEIDLNNNNAATGEGDGVTGYSSTPITTGLTISGAGTYHSTAAIAVNTGNGGIWNRGIVFDTASVVQSTFQDLGSPNKSIDIRGAPTFGIYQSNASSKNYFAGNVGIGTTSPQGTFEVRSAANDALLVRGHVNLNNGPSLYAVNDLNTNLEGMELAASQFYFVGGNVGIGTTSPAHQLTTTGSVQFATFGAGTLTTDANGNLSVSSDERLKNIQGSFTRGLDDLLKLDPVLYHWNGLSGLEQTTLYGGFSAQNVQLAIPEAVGTSSGGYLTLQDRPLIAAAVNAIKEIATITGTFQSNLINWLGNAANGITDLFANNVHAKHELCVGSGPSETCINQSQLAALLSQSAAASIANPSPPSPQSGTAGTTSTSTSSSTSSQGGTTTPAPSSSSTPPQIQINGENPATIPVGSTYADLGATITGPVADLNLGITILADNATSTTGAVTVNTTTTGTHTIIYTVTDPNGLTASAMRTVNVIASANGNAVAPTPASADAPTVNNNPPPTTSTSTTATSTAP